MKNILILPILLLSILFQTVACQTQKDAPMVKWKGNDDVNDLVFIIKPNPSPEEVEKFSNEVLYKPRADGRGYSHLDGVIDTMLGGINDGYFGGTINFHDNATAEQKENVRKAIEASPIVYKVYVNAIPDKLEGLPPLNKTEENSTPDNRPPKEIVNSEPKQDGVVEFFNINGKNDLLFFYTKDSTYEQRKYFDENILNKNTDRGHYFRDGVQGLFGIDKDGYEGFAIKYKAKATKEQKDEIINILKNSPIVFRVYENVKLDEINDLP